MAEINYAAVAFSLDGPNTLLECLTSLSSVGPCNVVPLARVRCRLHETGDPAPALATARERGWLRWQWRSGTAQVSTRSARARLWQTGGTYAAEAWLPPSARPAATLLSALSSAVLHDSGGFLLHAASVLDAAGVVAFVGPSGAGKSTACAHLQSGLTFSLDRMVVMPGPLRASPSESVVGKLPTWLAYPLCGGTALHPGAPRARPDWAPLRALLRVHQSPGGARVEDCPGSSGLASLRESAFSVNSDPSVELELLSRLERLQADVPVGRLHFGLGSSLEPVVSRWLTERNCRGHHGEYLHAASGNDED